MTSYRTPFVCGCTLVWTSAGKAPGTTHVARCGCGQDYYWRDGVITDERGLVLYKFALDAPAADKKEPEPEPPVDADEPVYTVVDLVDPMGREIRVTAPTGEFHIHQYDGKLQCSCPQSEHVEVCTHIRAAMQMGIDAALIYHDRAGKSASNPSIVVPVYTTGHAYQDLPSLSAHVRLMPTRNEQVKIAVYHNSSISEACKQDPKFCGILDNNTAMFMPEYLEDHPRSWALGTLSPGEGRAVLARLLHEKFSDQLLIHTDKRMMLACNAKSHQRISRVRAKENDVVRAKGLRRNHWNWCIWQTNKCPECTRLFNEATTDYPEGYEKK